MHASFCSLEILLKLTLMFLRYKSRRIGVQEGRPWHNFRSRDVNAKVVTELADLRKPSPKLVVRKAKNQP